MEEKESFTAIASAMMRAAHLVVDGEPKILRDEFALALSGFENDTKLMGAINQFVSQNAQPQFGADFPPFLFSSLRAIMTMRNRYAEAELDKAVRQGISQYVLLGAGLDSFALRRRDLAEILHIFEIDHPASQQWKRSRIQELNFEMPRNLTFVPIDFEKETLTEGLRAAGYRWDRPGFFSWLGVTQYLTDDAIFKTLKEIADMTPGTEIVFEYSVPEESLDEENRHYLAACKTAAAARGEPWLSFFEPDEMIIRLRQIGLAQIWSLSPEEAFQLYFAGRTDKLPCPKAHRLIKARVDHAP